GLRPILRGQGGPTEFASGRVLPVPVSGLLRRNRQRAWNRVARRRLAEPSGFSGDPCEQSDPRPFDHLEDTEADFYLLAGVPDGARGPDFGPTGWRAAAAARPVGRHWHAG